MGGRTHLFLQHSGYHIVLYIICTPPQKKKLWENWGELCARKRAGNLGARCTVMATLTAVVVGAMTSNGATALSF